MNNRSNVPLKEEIRTVSLSSPPCMCGSLSSPGCKLACGSREAHDTGQGSIYTEEVIALTSGMGRKSICNCPGKLFKSMFSGLSHL